jgi:14-3-3 protein epsilon
MADIWRPVKGVNIKEATKGLFLFQFSHELDMEAVLQGGPWSFDNHMLIVERVRLGVQIENIPLHHVDFWVQVHNLPVGLMAERVGIKLANYIGSFVEYDKNNKSSFWRQYMRLRVRIDVRRPLKKEKKIKNLGGEWCNVNFKYEKLGVFCFVCGKLGHSENKCEVRFAMENDDGTREWSSDLRAEPRRRGGRPTSRWLNEEGGGSGTVGGGRNSDTEFNADGPVVDPTRPNSPSMQPIGNPHSALIVPPVTVNRNEPIQEINSHSTNQAMITVPQQSMLFIPQSLPNNNLSPTPSQPNNDQLQHMINTPDNTITAQSFPNNYLAVPSPTFTQNVVESINQPFSFTSPAVAHLKHINNPLNRTVSLKPNQKINRSALTLNRTGTTKNPSNPNLNLNRNSEAMDLQTEKKRRREDEKKDTVSTQHFLSAGPGSQACRDQ